MNKRKHSKSDAPMRPKRRPRSGWAAQAVMSMCDRAVEACRTSGVDVPFEFAGFTFEQADEISRKGRIKSK